MKKDTYPIHIVNNITLIDKSGIQGPFVRELNVVLISLLTSGSTLLCAAFPVLLLPR